MSVGGNSTGPQDKTRGRSTQERRAETYSLRAQLRRIASARRVRHCGALPTIHATQHPSVVVRRVEGKAVASWHGLGVCEHIWDCPVCSARLRVERAQRIVAAAKQLGGRWQMLTLTIRHREGQLLKTLQRGLSAAWRRTRQGGKVQRIWSQNVTASARTLEVRRGENGWHVHLHVMLRTLEWSDEECRALWERYVVAVRRELGGDCVPTYSHAIRWSPARTIEPGDEQTAKKLAWYIAKFSLEVAGVSKRGKRGSLDPFDIARRAARGDGRSLRQWRDFQEATRGRRCIELDDRAAAAADLFAASQGDDKPLKEDDGLPPVEVEVTRDEVRCLRRYERKRRTIFADVLQAAEQGGASAVREWVTRSQHEVRQVRNGSDRGRFGVSGLRSAPTAEDVAHLSSGRRDGPAYVWDGPTDLQLRVHPYVARDGTRDTPPAGG